MLSGEDFIVCDCLGVTRDDIVEAIQSKGLTTADQVGEETEAGTMCGSCVPDIEEILYEVMQENKKNSA